jgi:iron complex outermembrane recepter protein
MSNSMNTPPTIRWQLLSTVSALALIGSAYAAHAAGNDADRPTLWIELGGQAENITGQGEAFVPAFLTANPTSPVFGPVTPLRAQRPPKFSFGEEGKISFEPEGTDWVFSAAVRIGRSSNRREVDHQTSGLSYLKYHNGAPPPSNKAIVTFEKFSDTKVDQHESHAILDFMAGKDVGLGMFGSSTLSGGIRIAQFTSRSRFDIRADPDLAFKYQTFAAFGLPSWELKLPHFHSYHATVQASRSFRGIGPSLSWNASTRLAGTADTSLTFDWGANAAILFGKQKANVSHHQTSVYVHDAGGAGFFMPYGQYYTGPGTSGGHHKDRSVVVPNLGGFAGLSFRYNDAKISLGYRADFFFGAIDGGIDARKSETLGFKGPFASVSVGLGD